MPTFPEAERHNQLIAKYCIPNMGGYSAVGGEVSLILDRLDVNNALSAGDKQWIRDKGLFDLDQFVKKLEETGQADFRILRTKFEQQQKKIIRKKFNIGYLEGHHLHQMTKILLRLDDGDRLSEKNVVWLSTNDYFFEYPEIKLKYHLNEAMFYKQCFEKNNDPWKAVNASSHFRKANCPTKALEILSNINITTQRDKHLRSALCTTKGGCMRDLSQFDDAIQLAEQAHSIDHNSFHPCTLLGAVNYEIGNYNLGDEWFTKAIERGAKIDDVDHELRSIFTRADKSRKEELKRHLLKLDSVRYSWVNSPKRHNKKKTQSN